MPAKLLRTFLYARRTVRAARLPIALVALGLALGTGGLLTMFAAAADPHLSSHPFKWMELAVAFFLSGGVASLTGRVLWGRLSRRATTERGGICPRCLYSGRDLGPPYTCPECGFTCSPSERRQIWEHAGLL